MSIRYQKEMYKPDVQTYIKTIINLQCSTNQLFTTMQRTIITLKLE